MARTLSKGEKPLDWVGSSKRDFLGFPEPVKDEMGNALGLARLGSGHLSAKPWKGQGPGVFELVYHDGDAYRAVYPVRFKEGRVRPARLPEEVAQRDQTAQVDVDLVERRLKVAQQDYEARYGKAKR